MSDKNYEKLEKTLWKSKVKNKSPHHKAREARSKKLLDDADFLEGCKHSVSDVSGDVKGEWRYNGALQRHFLLLKIAINGLKYHFC